MMCYKFLCTFNSSFVHIWFACQSGAYNFLTKVHMICLVAKRGQSRATKGHWKPLVKDLHNKTPPYKADRSRDWEKVKCHVYVMLPFRWLLFSPFFSWFGRFPSLWNCLSAQNARLCGTFHFICLEIFHLLWHPPVPLINWGQKQRRWFQPRRADASHAVTT